MQLSYLRRWGLIGEAPETLPNEFYSTALDALRAANQHGAGVDIPPHLLGRVLEELAATSDPRAGGDEVHPTRYERL